ncbi:transmembrane amino acid transporter protein-domain-containing protein [Mycena metata]|uniref:Transmembrane amino acid transporter protein-domain-containing protein n=1 Tax=Mycena metata TaxID=1033252 RepID=A0AAD7IHN4_9AGAR|nr:transmembrane amino acid transporter protein-domain-containing protein [Mycena metata]
MTSVPTSFYVGSASSTTGQSVRDAIASYRRAQYLAADSVVTSESDDSDGFSDEEAEIGFAEQDTDEETIQDAESPGSDTDGFIGHLDYDEIPSKRPESPTTLRSALSFSRKPPAQIRPVNERNYSELPSRNERTPLLRKTLSFTDSPRPRRMSTAVTNDSFGGPFGHPQRLPAMRRRSSGSSTRSITYRGQSTFGQTLFNSIAILLGIGMLSEPLAFAYAGWGTGLVLIIFYGYISCYTAKILAGITLSDPRIRSYAGVGRKAFGPRSTVVISILSCLRLFTASSVLVTLYADSLNTLIPRYSCNAYKIGGIFILIPTVFLPFSLLSYTSILGIISTILVVVVILIDGVTKTESPGSLWAPAETSLGITNYHHMGIAFGLFMAGFAGHALIPSLVRDMIDPSKSSKMINCAFGTATCIYTLIACAGYLMFGNSVSAEISMDLLTTPGYNPTLNQAALWMLVLSPLSKFGLITQPLNTTLQILLGIERPSGAPEDVRVRGTSVKSVLGVQRVVVALLSIAASILAPQFRATVAFVGSFFALLLGIVEPIAAKIALERRCGVFDGFVIVLAVGMVIWGTGAAINDLDEHSVFPRKVKW